MSKDPPTESLRHKLNPKRLYIEHRERVRVRQRLTEQPAAQEARDHGMIVTWDNEPTPREAASFPSSKAQAAPDKEETPAMTFENPFTLQKMSEAEWKKSVAEMRTDEKRFEELYSQKRVSLVREHVGQHIVINIMTGDHVISPSFSAAMRLAKEKFGGTDWCWSRQIKAL